ncbi:alpha/beta-hydrolase [Guyanagaster necrorhizus]|uniref:Alpha/beta-hydrolase n=1 Tax=Guyanagaster necrorhizus TaxID=856835 RepID=A0A9P7VV35_9AGAR|nr:alpha/beta-hydrolase [Guyanagaster necrorhizus MCA 3950]KAG7446699.1 alpha/beta-hydrolase [Guyanagaster necrorhizus MCA 3950]
MSGQFIASQDGTRIWAEAAGTPGKPPVVFVHGFLTSGLNWARQFGDKRLLESLYMIRYEIRGHGRSDQPESEDAYGSARHAEDFQASSEPRSLGGIIIPDLLSRFGTSPLPVAGHIMLNAIPWRSMLPEILTPYSTTILLPLSSPDLPDFQKALEGLISGFFSPGYLAQVSFEEKCAWVGSAASMNAAARTFSISRTQDEKALRSVSRDLPILCIQAMGDTLMESDKHEEFMKRHFGDNLEYRRVPGGGHAPFYEYPEIVNPMIIEFVRRVTIIQSRL